MADNTPENAGAPSDASKVQPKKETVRINLPPKPVAAPTVKIPAPAPAGGGKAAPAAGPGAGATQKLPSAAPAAPKSAPAAGGAPRPAPAMAPRAKKSVPTISAADKGLAIAALIVSIAVVVQLFLLGQP